MFKRHLLRRSEGECHLRQRYAAIHGGTLNIDDARTFTQKLYRRMIELHRADNPRFTELADKYRARDVVAGRVGSDYLIPLIWHGADAAAIPFDDLPARSIAMVNHASGRNIVLAKPIDQKAVIATLRRWLSENYYWAQREAHYFNIEPCAMMEEIIDDGHADGPLDYRVWCFDGKPEAIQMDNKPHTLSAFYSPDWKPLYATYRVKEHWRDIERPSNLDEMLSVAAKLSTGLDFVRIDLYSVKGKTYFGEFTFAPTAGCNKFDPPHWDLYFGERWR